MRLLFIGFGTVGQGLAELLVEKERRLKEEYGIDFSAVGISDMLKGSLVNAGGIDLAAALEKARSGEKLSELPGEEFTGDALEMIRTVDADVVLEATYTDIKTGEPATSHIRKALERGMHVVTSNKGPTALHYQELDLLAREKGVRFRPHLNVSADEIMQGIAIIRKVLTKGVYPNLKIFQDPCIGIGT